MALRFAQPALPPRGLGRSVGTTVPPRAHWLPAKSTAQSTTSRIDTANASTAPFLAWKMTCTVAASDDVKPLRTAMAPIKKQPHQSRSTSSAGLSYGRRCATCKVRGCPSKSSEKRQSRRANKNLFFFPSCFLGRKRSKKQNVRPQLLDARRSRYVYLDFLPSQNPQEFLFLQCRFPKKKKNFLLLKRTLGMNPQDPG